MSHAAFPSLSSDDLVTGEAVALDLPPASLGVRMASGLVDVALTGALLLVVIFTFLLAALRADGALAHVALVGTMIVVFLVVPTTVETLTRGKSLGKWALGLRTVRDDAGPISFQHAFVRALVGFVEIYATGGGAAFFSSMLSERGKRLGDYAAGTYVVRERVRLPARAPSPDARRAGRLGPAGRRRRAADRAGPRRAPVPPARRVARARLAAEGRRGPGASGVGVRRPAPAAWLRRRGVPRGGRRTRRERDQARLGRERAFRERLTARRR